MRHNRKHVHHIVTPKNATNMLKDAQRWMVCLTNLAEGPARKHGNSHVERIQ
jgi:hypothetical protein